MKAYVITIYGLPISESGATACIQSGRSHGLDIERFRAVNRYEAEQEMRAAGLFIDRTRYCRISDDPIVDRNKTPIGRWSLTTPEIGCLMSHFRIWQETANSGQPRAVFEHDALVVRPIPESVEDGKCFSLRNEPYLTTPGYIITPRSARAVIRHAELHGIQPSDEILWRSALTPNDVILPERSHIEVHDGGISTIQFWKADDTHAHIAEEDPWLDFRP